MLLFIILLVPIIMLALIAWVILLLFILILFALIVLYALTVLAPLLMMAFYHMHWYWRHLHSHNIHFDHEIISRYFLVLCFSSFLQLNLWNCSGYPLLIHHHSCWINLLNYGLVIRLWLRLTRWELFKAFGLWLGLIKQPIVSGRIIIIVEVIKVVLRVFIIPWAVLLKSVYCYIPVMVHSIQFRYLLQI